MKKIIALVLALAMVLMVGAAFADITITNTNSRISISGKTYNAYKLFDSTHTGTAYSYTMSTTSQFYSTNLLAAADADNKPTSGMAKVLWDNFTFTAVPGDTTKVNVAAKNSFDVRQFANDMQQYLASKTADASGTVAEGAETVTLDADDKGYYLVTGGADATSGADPTALVSAVIVTNEDPDPSIQPKADAPTLDKKITGVAEGDTVIDGAVLDTAGVAAVAKVGSTVSFELDAVVPDTTGYDRYTYTFHDTMSSGLTFVPGSYKIKFGSNDATTITPTVDGQSFSYTVSLETLRTYDVGTPIVLTYKATVNSDALTYDKENNTANLEYSNNPYNNTTEHTPDDKVYVIDINLDVNKINSGKTPLALASFKLYRNTNEYYKWDSTNNVVTWGADTEESPADVFTTDATGHLTQQIRGLDKGTYYLVETVAPEGYNLLPDPITVTISVSEANNQVTYSATFGSDAASMTNGVVDLTTATTNNKQPVATGTVLNQSGTVLPSTGGIGTTIFYILGGLLVIGAAVILVARRKAQN